MATLSLVVSALAFVPLFTSAAHADPCAKIAGQPFVLPSDALACQRAFPFNETLRQNVMSNVANVFNFFTFEDYYLNSPAPFQGSTVNIPAELSRINTSHYNTDYDFNWDLYTFATQLNDGHTRWFPACYNAFQSIAPAPIVSLSINGQENVYIAPDLVDFISQLGPGYTDALGNFSWQALAGAKVVEIEGKDPYDYVDTIADTASGNYLDHGVRVNSVFSSYRLNGDGNLTWSQRLGDFAGPLSTTQNSVSMTVLYPNATQSHKVTVPYLAAYIGAGNFTDSASFWAANCAVTNTTNGVDQKTVVNNGTAKATAVQPRHLQAAYSLPRGSIIDLSAMQAVGLPPQYQPNLTTAGGDEGVMKSYILPDGKTGVLYVGSFEGADDNLDFPEQFQTDVATAIGNFKAANVTHLIVDLHNNGGGYVCLGIFLHQYLVGSNFGYGGYQSTVRANPMAIEIVKSDIAQGLNSNYTDYTADNWAFLNGTAMPADYNWLSPSVSNQVNGQSDPQSQKVEDTCSVTFTTPLPATPPFDLNNVAIVGNGNCASTCALFSTLMYERHNTTIITYGGRPGQTMQYKGMAGNQVLDWVYLSNEVHTANLEGHPLAPPDLLINGNMRVNWRTAWSYSDNETQPIAYVSELGTYHFPYTLDTYMNPTNLWESAAKVAFQN